MGGIIPFFSVYLKNVYFADPTHRMASKQLWTACILYKTIHPHLWDIHSPTPHQEDQATKNTLEERFFACSWSFSISSPTYNYMLEAKETSSSSSVVVVEGGRGSLSLSWRCIWIFAGISSSARLHLDDSARGRAMGQRLKRYKTRLWIFSCMFVFFGVAGAATPLPCWTRGKLLLEYKLCAMHAWRRNATRRRVRGSGSWRRTCKKLPFGDAFRFLGKENSMNLIWTAVFRCWCCCFHCLYSCCSAKFSDSTSGNSEFLQLEIKSWSLQW